MNCHSDMRRFMAMLSVMALACIVSAAVVQAAVPNMVCAGNAQNGCTPNGGCKAASGGWECASTIYHYVERTSKSYKHCNGAAGPCAGGEAKYEVCTNEAHIWSIVLGKCDPEVKCTLSSQITNGCPG